MFEYSMKLELKSSSGVNKIFVKRKIVCRYAAVVLQLITSFSGVLLQVLIELIRGDRP